VVEAARIHAAPAGVVNELDGHELVARELEHGEASELGLGHGADHLVPQPGVERE
jgi:hypothetical protein